MAEFNHDETTPERERREMLERHGHGQNYEAGSNSYAVPIAVVLGALLLVGALIYGSTDDRTTPNTQVGQNVERTAPPPAAPLPNKAPQQ